MFHADLDQLADLLDELTRDDDAMELMAADLARDLARLHERWDGSAASAHLAAQAEWDAGFAAMRSALRSMRAVAATARDNYAGAAEANVAMWDQVA